MCGLGSFFVFLLTVVAYWFRHLFACAGVMSAGPAAAVGLDGLGVGSLRPGSVADVAAFQIAQGDYEFEDTAGFAFRGKLSLRPRLTVRGDLLVFSSGMD